jgi:ribonuclease G
MSKELVIGSNRHETKVAVLEDDQVVEVYFQRANEYSLAGSIHKGKVTRVLPGMQSAFVDLGLERDTFLYVSDFFEEHDDIDTVSDEKPGRGERRERNGFRGGDRRSAQRPVQAIEDQPSEAKEAAPVAGEVDAVPSVEGAAENPGTEAAEGGERNLRNDRRGRRSRRRRPRGRGFPDNKYAQPSENGSSGEAQPEAAAAIESEIEGESDELEVILLPGESLAKYRHAPAAASSEPADHEDEFVDSVETAEEIHLVDPDAHAAIDEEAELAEEAEEIALADRVFSHHDDDLPVTEEIDEPQSEAPHALGASSPVVTNLEPLVAPEDLEPSDASVLRQQPIALDEYEVLAIKEGLTGIDEPVLDAATEFPQTRLAEEPIEPEPDIDAEPNVESEGLASTEEAPASESTVQSASVREPNGRYMHRVSRRMRRRRGGNRGGQQDQQRNQEVSAEGVTTEAPTLVTGTGAAVAPEARVETPREERSFEKQDRTYPSISDLLKPGQEIIVQIAKEPLGQKGARITSHIALPGRYVVFMPSVNHLGVSRKVASDEERQRLKKILQARRPGPTGGFIVRTAGEGIPEEEIGADMKFLYDLWLDIKQKAEKKPAPALLHYDLDIVQRILRDQVTNDFKAIWVDNEDLYESVVTFMQRFQPALVNRVKMYTRQAPIFDAFNITQELEKALRPKVWLKSGGYIVINQTEALVAIDINTGKYVGKSNRLEDTIVKTNTEAVKEIVRQIRLRDLGGIIVVDFIDMDERKNRQKVMQALEEAMRADKAPYKILQFNDFGLVAITRKRVKQSLERTLCSPCPYCEAAGYVKSVPTVISEILIEAQKISRAIEGTDVVLRVHPDVAKVLKASDNQYLEELEEVLKRPVLVTGDATLHHQKFDLA